MSSVVLPLLCGVSTLYYLLSPLLGPAGPLGTNPSPSLCQRPASSLPKQGASLRRPGPGVTRPEISGPFPAAGNCPETWAVASGPPEEEEVDGSKSPLCPLSGGNLRGPRHSHPRPPLLRILRQLRHNPHLPAVDVLHFLRQVTCGGPLRLRDFRATEGRDLGTCRGSQKPLVSCQLDDGMFLGS